MSNETFANIESTNRLKLFDYVKFRNAINSITQAFSTFTFFFASVKPDNFKL